MNAVLQTPQRLLLSVSTDELTGLCNALAPLPPARTDQSFKKIGHMAEAMVRWPEDDGSVR